MNQSCTLYLIDAHEIYKSRDHNAYLQLSRQMEHFIKDFLIYIIHFISVPDIKLFFLVLRYKTNVEFGPAKLYTHINHLKKRVHLLDDI